MLTHVKVSGERVMDVVVTARLGMVRRVGVEPTRPYGQRILSPMHPVLPSPTKSRVRAPKAIAVAIVVSLCE